MQARRTLIPDQKGAKKFLDRYGEELVSVRYRCDEPRRKRFTTVEIFVEESGWSLPDKPEIVALRVELRETELQGWVKQAAARSWSMKATGTSITCNGGWMEEEMRCQTWSCCT